MTIVDLCVQNELTSGNEHVSCINAVNFHTANVSLAFFLQKTKEIAPLS
jgi:hypothetical protein